LKRLIPYLLLLIACGQPNSKPDSLDRRLEIVFWPAFTEHSHVTVKGDSVTILLDKHPFFELTMGLDTFYYRRIVLQKQQAEYFDSAILKKAYSLRQEPKQPGRDGMGIYFSRFSSNKVDTLDYLNPSTGSEGHSLSVESIRFLKDSFQDSVLSPYFDELREYLLPNRQSQDDSMNALKRRREAVYPKLRYRR
jgi:hypothetical protein